MTNIHLHRPDPMLLCTVEKPMHHSDSPRDPNDPRLQEASAQRPFHLDLDDLLTCCCMLRLLQECAGSIW